MRKTPITEEEKKKYLEYQKLYRMKRRDPQFEVELKESLEKGKLNKDKMIKAVAKLQDYWERS